MLRHHNAFLVLVLLWVSSVLSAVTWPSSYDELEDIMLLNQGYNARQFSLPVTPCDFQRSPGRVPAAGFVRTAFHDVAPHNAATGEGGMDASIAWELTGRAGQDNAGPAFNNTLTFISQYYSTRASMSDLLALALYTAVRGCGGPIIPIRTGRVDATGAGALGVPAVNDTQSGLRNVFGRMGFSAQDMVKMVACGHTLGGVHAQQFPQIVSPGTRTNDVATFDNTTTTFDNAVAVDFVNNRTINPLVVGPELTNSDKKVYTVDGGLTIRQLAETQTFQNSCKDILQRMIDTVPAHVQLTDAIEVYDVKPGKLALTLAVDGSSFLFTGEIRLRTTTTPQTSIGSVTLIYRDRAGETGGSIIANAIGTAAGYDESFTFYNFSSVLDVRSSISTFDVAVTLKDGSSITYDNNGKGYQVQDVIHLHRPACSISNDVDSTGKYTVTVVAAALSSASKVSLTVALQTSREVPFPLLTRSDVVMTMADTIGQYILYRGSFSVSAAQINSTTFDLSCEEGGSTFTYPFQRLKGFAAEKSLNQTVPTNPTTTISVTTTLFSTTSTTIHSHDITTSSSTANTLPVGPHSSSKTSTPPSSTTETSSIDKYGQGWSVWVPPVASEVASPVPNVPCGPSAGCAAESWAHNPVWAISTPTGAFAHTNPAGLVSGSLWNGPTATRTITIETSTQPWRVETSGAQAGTQSISGSGQSASNVPVFQAVNSTSPVTPFKGTAGKHGLSQVIGFTCIAFVLTVAVL